MLNNESFYPVQISLLDVNQVEFFADLIPCLIEHFHGSDNIPFL